MKAIVLALFAALTLYAGSVSATYYRMIDGTIVDPIQDVRGGDSAYSGNNLQGEWPVYGWANAESANLSYADLQYADLEYASLRYADLNHANLSNADLRQTNLSYTDLTNADLSNAVLTYGSQYERLRHFCFQTLQTMLSKSPNFTIGTVADVPSASEI